MLRYLALLALLLAPSVAFAQPAPETAPAAVSAPSSAAGPVALAAPPAAVDSGALALAVAQPGVPAYTLPPGFSLVQDSAEVPWWKELLTGLLSNPKAWAVLLMLGFALWRHFDLEGATKAQAILNEAASVAYGATEEAKRLGEVGVSGVTETFIGLFTEEMKAGKQKVTPEAIAKALRRVKSINAAAKAAEKVAAPADPTEAPSLP